MTLNCKKDELRPCELSSLLTLVINQIAFPFSKDKFDVGMAKNATVGSAKYRIYPQKLDSQLVRFSNLLFPLTYIDSLTVNKVYCK